MTRFIYTGGSKVSILGFSGRTYTFRRDKASGSPLPVMVEDEDAPLVQGHQGMKKIVYPSWEPRVVPRDPSPDGRKKSKRHTKPLDN